MAQISTPHFPLRVILCALLLAVAAVVIASNITEDDSRGTLLARGEDQNKHAQSFAEWYRQMSADTWFGSSTFNHNTAKTRKHEHWLDKKDLELIPSVEKAKANARLKARLIELTMSTLQQQQKARRLAAVLKSKLDNVKAQPYQQTWTRGDKEDLNQTTIDQIIKTLNFQFQNRTVMNSRDFEISHERMTPEQRAALEAERKANELAERETTKALEKASPVLRETYERELKAHKKQGEQLDELERLLTSVTQQARYHSADIGDNCEGGCAEAAASASPAARASASPARRQAALRRLGRLKGRTVP